ncbi:MAG TPA: hypothetical protein VFX51_26425 [Solirubrobacteraceae bacterium]|nr:hypothetical protein [Solirubrobacteraceae bacterium]
MSQTPQIDWNSAAVDDRQLTVPLTGKPSKQWADAVTRVLGRLQRDSERWGAIQVTKKRFRVDGVQPGAEPDVRHLLESAVLQANSTLEPDDDESEADDERSDADQQMTDAFRAFADDGS